MSFGSCRAPGGRRRGRRTSRVHPARRRIHFFYVTVRPERRSTPQWLVTSLKCAAAFVPSLKASISDECSVLQSPTIRHHFCSCIRLHVATEQDGKSKDRPQTCHFRSAGDVSAVSQVKVHSDTERSVATTNFKHFSFIYQALKPCKTSSNYSKMTNNSVNL